MMPVREGIMSASAENELIEVAHEWDRAMVTNDADAIGSYRADEWVIVGSDGNMVVRWSESRACSCAARRAGAAC
jgi:hypothetical protein